MSITMNYPLSPIIVDSEDSDSGCYTSSDSEENPGYYQPLLQTNDTPIPTSNSPKYTSLPGCPAIPLLDLSSVELGSSSRQVQSDYGKLLEQISAHPTLMEDMLDYVKTSLNEAETRKINAAFSDKLETDLEDVSSEIRSKFYHAKHLKSEEYDVTDIKTNYQLRCTILQDCKDDIKQAMTIELAQRYCQLIRCNKALEKSRAMIIKLEKK